MPTPRFKTVSGMANADDPLIVNYDGRRLVLPAGEEFDLPDWLPVEAVAGQVEHFEAVNPAAKKAVRDHYKEPDPEPEPAALAVSTPEEK